MSCSFGLLESGRLLPFEFEISREIIIVRFIVELACHMYTKAGQEQPLLGSYL